MVVTILLFLTTSTSACRRQFADVPAGCDLTDFRCPMCTSAEPYRQPNWHLEWFSHFRTAHGRVSLGMSVPLKIAPSHGAIWTPSKLHSGTLLLGNCDKQGQIHCQYCHVTFTRRVTYVSGIQKQSQNFYNNNHNHNLHEYLSLALILNNTRMWATAQRDGRPAEHRWRPLFNAAKFGQRSLLDCRVVTLPRRKSR